MKKVWVIIYSAALYSLSGTEKNDMLYKIWYPRFDEIPYNSASAEVKINLLFHSMVVVEHRLWGKRGQGIIINNVLYTMCNVPSRVHGSHITLGTHPMNCSQV